MSTRQPRIESDEQLRNLKAAALGNEVVSMGSRRLESVHEFYRYPGRFAPSFVRAAVEAFSMPGDVVLDPFVGGGTTLVEARLAGRIGVGADINQLATFVSRAKTATPSSGQVEALTNWAEMIDGEVRLGGRTARPERWEAGGYFEGLGSRETWRIRDFLIRLVDAVPNDPIGNLLARCSLLRTAQWALDIRQSVPTLPTFRNALINDIRRMAAVSDQFSKQAQLIDASTPSELPRTTVVHSATSGLQRHPSIKRLPPASLVVTSPPYPGVYVLYHRWKLRGRREISTPYWLTGVPDGNGLSHYTMGARARVNLDHYFDRLARSFAEFLQFVKPGALVVQQIGFSDVEDQLRTYLDIMTSLGLQEVKFPTLATATDGRLWRTVPSRRWWVTAKSRQDNGRQTAREVVLLHRVSARVRPRR